MFEFKPGRYYIGFWYFEIPDETEGFGKMGPFGKGGNFTCLVRREGDGALDEKARWTTQYRFRYHRDERIHDHKDRMTWITLEVADRTEAEIFEATAVWMTVSAAAIGQVHEFFAIRGDNLEFDRKARTAPPSWLHLYPRAVEKDSQ